MIHTGYVCVWWTGGGVQGRPSLTGVKRIDQGVGGDSGDLKHCASQSALTGRR